MLEEALRREPARSDLPRLAAYAEGMDRYLAGRHPEAVERLAAWVDAHPPADEEAFGDLAYAAVSRIAEHARTGGGTDGKLATTAAELAKRLQPFAPHARTEAAGR